MEETLSSLVASMRDPANGSSPGTTPNPSTLLGQEELQQELVVKAIKVKKRSRRQQGKLTLTDRSLLLIICSNRWSSLADSSQCSCLSDSSLSDSVSVAQHSSCSEGASGTDVSEQALLVCMEVPNQGCGEHHQDPQSKEAKYG